MARARNLQELQTLRTAADVIDCLREDPVDRVLHYASDLAPQDFDGAIATRTDDAILVVGSLKAVGASSINEWVDLLRAEVCPSGPRPSEIAVVGLPENRNRWGWVIPSDIAQLLHDAEEGRQGSLLSKAGYDDLFVLAGHPEAEVLA